MTDRVAPGLEKSYEDALGGAESLAAGEPDEPNREAGTDGSRPLDVTEAGRPVRSHHDSIWKSVIGATGGWGCERATFYRETVRDARGYRLRFGAGEPVVFGIGVDVAHEYLMGRRFSDGAVDASYIGLDTSDDGIGEPVTEAEVRELLGSAVTAGYEKARARLRSEPWTDDDWSRLRDRLSLAVEKLLGLWPNRVSVKDGEQYPAPEPEGTPAGPPIGWLDPGPDIYTHAQRKMHAPGVVGGRGMTGQPDYVFTREGVIVGWVDVKALSKSGSYPAKWAAGEAVAYDYLCSVESGGVLPEWHGYLEYRRVAKPYWALITAPVAPGVLGLADAYFRRWERALDGHDPDGLAFNPLRCGTCDYRDPLADHGRPVHPGCPIGGPAMDVVPAAEDDAPG